MRRVACPLVALAFVGVAVCSLSPSASPDTGSQFLARDSAPPAAASTEPARPEDALEHLLAQDRRVAAIAYRLAVANRELCEDQGPQWGLTIHSASQYGPRLRPVVQARFAIGAFVAVSGVAPGGPAAEAGLAVGDRIVSIDGVSLAPPRADRRIDPGAPASHRQFDQALAILARSPPAGARFVVLRGDSPLYLTVTPHIGCAYDTQVTPSNVPNASADGRHVFITSAFVDFAERDQDLALILGHELAHNVLQHRRELDRIGFARPLLGNFGNAPSDLVRTEREADYVGLYLDARAGYDISGAEDYWRRSIAVLGDPWDRRWSHPGGRQREVNARATVAEIEAKVRAGQPLVPEMDRLRQRVQAQDAPAAQAH